MSRINIVLFEPEIPGNTGNIMRTCAATECYLHLIEPLGFSLSEKYLKRSGVNYLENCHYFLYDDLNDFFTRCKGKYYFFIWYGHKPHSDANFVLNDEEDIYLIFGKESTGLPLDLLKKNLDNCYRIPMSDNVRALNVSNSVAIALYEALRQNNYMNLLLDEPFKGKNFIEES